MHGVGQEAASIPAAPCLAWHSIKRAVLGPVKSPSWQRKPSLWGCCGGARARQGGETRDPAQQLGHNEEGNYSYSCIRINATATIHFCPTFFSLLEHFILNIFFDYERRVALCEI